MTTGFSTYTSDAMLLRVTTTTICACTAWICKFVYVSLGSLLSLLKRLLSVEFQQTPNKLCVLFVSDDFFFYVCFEQILICLLSLAQGICMHQRIYED
jgi:hypothetical protein